MKTSFKRILGFAAISLFVATSSFTSAEACSPQKLAMLKNRCKNATVMQKAAYCAVAANPHSTKNIQNERHYNEKYIPKAASGKNSQQAVRTGGTRPASFKVKKN